MRRTTRLKQPIAAPEIVVLPGVHDALAVNGLDDAIARAQMAHEVALQDAAAALVSRHRTR